VAQDVDNLLVAGRALSATHVAAGSARGQPVCMAMGHAAGTMAAMAALGGQRPEDLAMAAVQDQLRAQKAVLERPSTPA